MPPSISPRCVHVAWVPQRDRESSIMQRKLESWEGNAAGIPGRDGARTERQAWGRQGQAGRHGIYPGGDGDAHEIRWKAVMPAGLCWLCFATLIAGVCLGSRGASLRSLCNPPLINRPHRAFPPTPPYPPTLRSSPLVCLWDCLRRRRSQSSVLQQVTLHERLSVARRWSERVSLMRVKGH
jgi:hypothetical protein